jgi:hypothetical protein
MAKKNIRSESNLLGWPKKIAEDKRSSLFCPAVRKKADKIFTVARRRCQTSTSRKNKVRKLG